MHHLSSVMLEDVINLTTEKCVGLQTCVCVCVCVSAVNDKTDIISSVLFSPV